MLPKYTQCELHNSCPELEVKGVAYKWFGYTVHVLSSANVYNQTT